MPQASSLQAAIKDKYGITAVLKEGHSGIFEVSINDDVVYTNETTYRFPNDEEIFEKIDAAKR
ncbi:MAG TPA: Rdx family protein [Methylomirabilota bacterium]|nr:Rdx family protein [Candidatus Polarisedimenticolaceae bacterium]HZO42535.1 Rdx family protein [Methylomirabilota bacterium]